MKFTLGKRSCIFQDCIFFLGFLGFFYDMLGKCLLAALAFFIHQVVICIS